MVDLASIKQKVDNIIHNKEINRTIEVSKYSKPSLNKYGDEERNFLCQDIIEAIVLSYDRASPRYDEAGKYRQSTSIVIISSDYTINEWDELIFDNSEHVIITVKPKRLGERITHNIVFVEEKL